MIDDEVDEFLEHFGVKGMKWGVRNKRSSDGQKGMSDQTKRRLKTGLTAAAVIGTVAAAVIVSQKSGHNINSLRSASKQVGAMGARTLMNAKGNTKASSIPRPPRNTRLDPGQDAWVKAFAQRQTQLNREANADLRGRDNDLNIPFAQRTYLSDWVDA